MPVRHVLVGDTRGDIEHDDTTLSLNVVTITQTTKLFLASCVPHIKDNRTKVCVELQRVHFHAKRRYNVSASTSHIPIYFFSNSPVKWRFTNVVLPVPPSPTAISHLYIPSTSLKLGTFCASAMINSNGRGGDCAPPKTLDFFALPWRESRACMPHFFR